MKRIELLCFLLLVIAGTVAYSSMSAWKPIMIAATAVNVLFYFISGIGLTRNTFLPSAWKYTPPEMRPSLIMKTASGLIFSFCVLVLCFNELFLPHHNTYTLIGVSLLTVVMFFSMKLLEDDQPKLNRDILMRSALLSLLLTFYFVTPLSYRIKWRFEDAYYRELLQFSLENPTNEEAYRDLIDYEKRMEGQPTFSPLE
jgi:uncharacterized membrane protein